ncbi:acyltransferase family protein [Elizabethkingia meningoseptica]
MNNKIESLQIIRCIAAVLVAICHIWNDGWLPGYFVEFGAKFGVDLFFVLSGFIMCLTVKLIPDNKGQSAVHFLKKRIIRIFPIYIIIAIPLLLFNIKAEGLKSLYFYIGNLLLLPSFNNNTNYFFVLGPGWTLAYEMLFYYTFSFFILLFSSRNKLLFANLIFISGTILFVNFFGLQGDQLGWVNFSYIIGDTLLLNFALGIVCYYFFMKFNKKIHIDYRVSLIVLFIISCFVIYLNNNGDYPRFVLFGIPAFIIICIFSVTVNPPGENKFFNKVIFLGDASYSIYLIHYYFAFIKPKIFLLKNYIIMDFNIFLNLSDIALLVCAIISGGIFYSYVEKPLTRILSKKIFNKYTI